MASYIRENEYQKLNQQILMWGVRQTAGLCGRNQGTLYRIKNTKDYNEYRHLYQPRICPCPDHRGAYESVDDSGTVVYKSDLGIDVLRRKNEKFYDNQDMQLITNDDLNRKLDKIISMLDALTYLIK